MYTSRTLLSGCLLGQLHASQYLPFIYWKGSSLSLRCICSSLRMRKLAKQGKTGTPDQDPDGIGNADVERTPMSLPKAHTGRPDVEAVLASLCEQHSDDSSIGVIAAGAKGIALPLLLTVLLEQRSAEGCSEIAAFKALQ